MARIDSEGIVRNLISVYQTKLNTKITEVDAEKVAGGGIALMKNVDNNAYFTSLNGKIANYNPVIMIGEVDNESESNGSDVSEKPQFSVVIIVNDSNTDELPFTMLRYRRCLKEVAADNWKKLNNGLKSEVQSLQPISLKGINTSETYKAIGITIETSFFN